MWSGRGVKEKSGVVPLAKAVKDTVVVSSSDVEEPVDATSSYANVTGKPNGKKVKVRTLFTPGGNGIDVVVPVDSIRAISERFSNIAYGFFLGEKVAYPVVANYVRNTWDAMLKNGPWFIQNNPLILKKWHPDENLLKEDVSTIPVWAKLHGVPVTAFNEDGLSAIATKLVMIELRADVELKDNIVVAMPKITREGHYICNVHVEYEWKPPRYSSYKVFGHIHEECPKNTCVGEKNTMKKPSQTSQGVPVGPKVGFKPQKEYRLVPKKPNASSSGNKKKGVEPTIEVSNSNSFDVLNSVDNDVEFGTNEGTTNLINNGATSSGSSFMNIDNDGEFASNTPIGEKIDKIERQICKGKLRLLDNDGKPLFPTGIVESDSEVEVVFDETANLSISTSGKDESDKDTRSQDGKDQRQIRKRFKDLETESQKIKAQDQRSQSMMEQVYYNKVQDMDQGNKTSKLL
ncbi:RNA-directed DNA polymerase, eukaryota, reverse transcriptase zinc-binding domain protein [Tanacetum coccineum]